MGSIRKLFYMLVVLTGLGFVAAACAAIYAWDYFDAPGPLAAETTVIFKRNAGFNDIVGHLTQQGVIDNPLLFKAIATGLGTGRKFKAGEYSFAASVTPHQVMNKLVSGKVVVHKITVPEGLTVKEIVEMLQKEAVLEGDIGEVKEGSLLPETYHFVYGDQRQQVIDRMQAGMRKLLDGLWEKRRADLPFSTMEQALTLASIVEKETGVPNERGQVASVFTNRLRLGMRLQSDPTVVYGMEKAMGAPLGRPLTSLDLRTETPYNTYIVVGLPPGPIANPGKASVEAVFNPPDTDFLYFVATGKGGHNFSASLEEHNRFVQLYRKQLQQQ
jgi:UPF0755 protein